MKFDRPIEESVRIVGAHWADSPYYAAAEDALPLFWDAVSPFALLFDHMALDTALELGCGHGRHADVVAPKSGKLLLMDIHDNNLSTCRRRLIRFRNVEYILNNGYDFYPLEDGTISAIFSYDSMVHFSPDVVASYLKDCSRVLRPGGHALFHHSNYPAPMDRPYGSNPHARNHMTADLFASLAEKGGLEIVSQQVIKWARVPDLDCLTLLRRPV